MSVMTKTQMEAVEALLASTEALESARKIYNDAKRKYDNARLSVERLVPALFRGPMTESED